MSYEIIVCGHLCLDLLPGMESVKPDDLVTPGRLFEMGALQMSTGGAVSNTGLALHRLGIRVGLMGLVGDDLLGQVILGFLRGHEQYLGDFVQILPKTSSSATIVLSPENQDRTFLQCAGTNEIFGYDNIDFDAVQQGDIFHLGYPTILPKLFRNDGEELVAIFKKVKNELDLITSMDMTLPDPNRASGKAAWQTILKNTLPFVDIFIPSIEEILFMLRRDDYDEWNGDVLSRITLEYLASLAEELIQMGVGIVGFKLGEQGIYIHSAAQSQQLSFLQKINQSIDQWTKKRHWHPAFQVDVVGTTGAGDAAYAGFLTALYQGYDPIGCAQWACAVGACNVEASDATSGVRSWEETKKRMDRGWQTLEFAEFQEDGLRS